MKHSFWPAAVVRSAFALAIFFVCAGSALAGDLGPAATQTDLRISQDSGSIATLTARVTALNAEGAAPDGVINFRSGNEDLGSAVVDTQGTATLKTGNLGPGTHQVVAVYEGNAAYSPSISPSSQLDTSTPPVAGYSVAANPSSLKTIAGGFVSSVLTVTPVSGFNAYVSLSCSGLPVSATCTFSPTNVLAACTSGAGGSQVCTPGTSTMQIQTLSPGGGRTSAEKRGKGFPAYAFTFPVVFGLAGLGLRKKRALFHIFVVLFLLTGSLSLTACKEQYNYFNHGPPANPGTPVGNYTVTIDAVSTSGSLITRPATSPQITLTVTGGS